MRLDKFFQITGLIKRRTLANEACKRDLAKVNGLVAKPTREIKEGDIVELDLPRRFVRVRLLKSISSSSIPKSRRPEFLEFLEDISKEPQPDDWSSDEE